MFDAAAPVAAVQPDPPRAVPAHIGQILGLVHTLIAYGKNLADTLRQHAADPHVLPCFAWVASIFGTGDPALILARITRGLLRAAALEARLSRRAARGRDLKPMPVRLPRKRTPRAAKPADPPGGPVNHPGLARLPTIEEIVAKDRRRPIGAVLVGICVDLGIVPGQMGGATWCELRRDILLYGGSLATLLHGPKASRAPANPPTPSVPPSSRLPLAPGLSREANQCRGADRRGKRAAALLRRSPSWCFPPWPAPPLNPQLPPAPAHPEPAQVGLRPL